MKAFLKAACVAFILTVVYTMIPFQASCSDISREVFRLHILANSDSADDQALKLLVRDRVLEASQALFEQAQTKEEADTLVKRNLHMLCEVAARTVQDSGCNYPVRAELTRMYFTTRHYEKYTLPSGMYDALRLTIGAGKGHNWWCVMFPSLCINTEETGDRKTKETLGDKDYHIIREKQPEYKFFVIEMFESIRRMVQASD